MYRVTRLKKSTSILSLLPHPFERRWGMRKYLTLLLLSLITFSHAHARSNALEKEMEDYARDIIRAHSELAGNLKTREARLDIYNKAKKAKLLELSKEDARKLRKRDATISDDSFKEALELIKSMQSKEPQITFLIKYAENPKIKAAEKLLAYRLIKHNQTILTNKINHARKELVSAALSQYTDYKDSNKKPAATLEELELRDSQQYTHPTTGEKSDWIYLAHPKIRLKTGNSYIVLAEPEGHGGIRFCGLDNGETVTMKDVPIQKSITQTQASIKKYKEDKAAGKTSPTTKKVPHPIVGLMKKIKAYQNKHDGSRPSSLDDLNLPDREKQYIDPASGKRYDWLYFGDNSPLKIGGNLTVIILAPKAHNGRHVLGLSDGRVGMMTAEQMKKIPQATLNKNNADSEKK